MSFFVCAMDNEIEKYHVGIIEKMIYEYIFHKFYIVGL